MSDDIFGYSWEEIQRAQQGGKLRKTVTSNSVRDEWTTSDEELFQQHGKSYHTLIDAGFHGVADRLARGLRNIP